VKELAGSFMPEPYGWWDGGMPNHQAIGRAAVR